MIGCLVLLLLVFVFYLISLLFGDGCLGYQIIAGLLLLIAVIRKKTSPGGGTGRLSC